MAASKVLGLGPSSSLGLLDVVPAVGTLCVALPMYVATAFPSVPGGDSGELIAEACKAKGGVAHPPGYPLYLLLLQAAFKLEVLDGLTPAYIANVENALFAAVAAASITHFVYLYTNKANAFAAIASGLMFAFAPLTWEYAAGAEVFALNNMLLAVLFVLCAVFKRSHSIFAASAGALICGLALEGPADETSPPLTDSTTPSTTTRPASTEPTATPEQRALDDLLLLTFLHYLVCFNSLANLPLYMSGVVISSYGNALLDTLPPNSVLLSYTDINWNSVRYLQECEKKRPDVTHLNFQLMPYSWYSRQHDLYPGITFPPLIQGVSTERGSKGFEQLTRRFVMQNMYALNMYLDLHAVVCHCDISIDPVTCRTERIGTGQRRVLQWVLRDAARDAVEDPRAEKVVIVPRGHRDADPVPRMPTYSTWNKESKALFRMYNQSFALAHSAKYPAGSWEYVARKIYFDGLYQKALHSLQYWIDRTAKKGKDVTYDDLDGYMFGLRDIVKALNGIYHIALPNLALTYVRYHGALVLAERQPARDLPISKQLVHDVKVEAVRISNEFLELSPKDKDIEVFQTFVDTVDNPEATAAEASAKKVKKTKKKKARPHQVVEEEL
ncbi:hypothetical protein DYB32_005577 [Aphanomyces invadans]|uniref:DUF2723 domain-containing protein n=1 Tax=Aphanomyces invadans TaxID=157072 RepID=A0A3R6Y7S4_9STRA|nr:hypothetical protein DYB32_005577 [Aphanomyces invadans]